MTRWVAFLLLAASAQAAPPLGVIRDYLVRWEGYRLTPYKDRGHWSVGVGHNLTVNREPVRRYSAAEVETLLWRDVSWALDVCRAGVTDFDDLPHDVQLVCIGLAFGVGRVGFMRFTNLRRALSWRAYHAASQELGLSKWYTQVSPARARAARQVLLNQP